jgi:hypothetical protein
VSTVEDLLERESSGFGLENRDYSRSGSTTLSDTPLSAKVGTNFAYKHGRAVGIVRSRTQTTEFYIIIVIIVGIVVVEVKFLDRRKTDRSESICQECFL